MSPLLPLQSPDVTTHKVLILEGITLYISLSSLSFFLLVIRSSENCAKLVLFTIQEPRKVGWPLLWSCNSGWIGVYQAFTGEFRLVIIGFLGDVWAWFTRCVFHGICECGFYWPDGTLQCATYTAFWFLVCWGVLWEQGSMLWVWQFFLLLETFL